MCPGQEKASTFHSHLENMFCTDRLVAKIFVAFGYPKFLSQALYPVAVHVKAIAFLFSKYIFFFADTLLLSCVITVSLLLGCAF
jgi:hypothetical protein